MHRRMIAQILGWYLLIEKHIPTLDLKINIGRMQSLIKLGLGFVLH
jgi:hypothetical protein